MKRMSNKKATKKKVSKKKAVKRTTKRIAKKASKKKAVKKKAAMGYGDSSSKTSHPLPPNYIIRDGLAVPQTFMTPVPADKISKGLDKAKGRIKMMINSLSDTLTKEYEVESIQFSVSFDAEGKVMGIGVGGSTSVSVTVKPKG